VLLVVGVVQAQYLETVIPVGDTPLDVLWNPTRGNVLLTGLNGSPRNVAVRDVTGRVISRAAVGRGVNGRTILDLTNVRPGVYVVEMRTGDTVRAAYCDRAYAGQPQSWVHMPLTTVSGESFTKGKLYEFRFTRSGSDSIQYYWQETPDTSVVNRSPYPYGFLLVNGQGDSAKDLACRVMGQSVAAAA
jgi:hypothetical protein